MWPELLAGSFHQLLLEVTRVGTTGTTAITGTTGITGRAGAGIPNVKTGGDNGGGAANGGD